MKKYLFALFALLACSFNADATLGLLGGSASGVVVGYDAYGGVTNVSCTNPNGTSYFGLATVASHKVLCDPAGHPYFGRGFYVFDDSSLGNDESGGNYGSYIAAKYGATNTPYTWDTAEVARFKSWGFNMIGPESSAYALAFWNWVPSGTNPNKVPYVITEEGCSYSWNNTGGWGTAPVKDVLSTASANWNGTGYYGYGGVTDYEDPAWTNFLDGEMSSSGDSVFSDLIAASATDKSYMIGVFGCDSDNDHGFGAGPDFVTFPSSGNNDFRLSYEIALGSPVEWASTHQHQIYTDSTVYNKKAWYTQLTGEYASISALNTAWGSSYTTFGTSGTCYGAGFASWICPSPSAATSVGTGNGSTLTFSTTLTTTVSANSVGIFIAGTLVGGDGGNGPFSGTAGTIYGPNLSGTINYSTGALSITFTSGHAPANGAAITAEYIANGWGIGTGLMDEDGRSAHQTWTGHNGVCIDGVGVSSACSPYGTSYASAGMVSDLNTLDVTLSTKYASAYKSAITAHLPGALFLGPLNFGDWNAPPNRYVIQGMAPDTDIAIVNSNAGHAFSQSELDFVQAHGSDMALGLSTYNVANIDSPFAWPSSSCSRSGTTVTCTVATPQNFSTSVAIQTSCTDNTYNVTNTSPSSVTTSTVVYTANSTPTNPSTTCNVAFTDINVNGVYTTMSGRATTVGAEMQALTSTKYTADGVYPYVMTLWWQWSDKQDEELSWGVVDTRDNAYDGSETTTATVACQAPLQAYNCGGEIRSGWGSDNGLFALINATTAIDTALAGL